MFFVLFIIKHFVLNRTMKSQRFNYYIIYYYKNISNSSIKRGNLLSVHKMRMRISWQNVNINKTGSAASKSRRPDWRNLIKNHHKKNLPVQPSVIFVQSQLILMILIVGYLNPCQKSSITVNPIPVKQYPWSQENMLEHTRAVFNHFSAKVKIVHCCVI